MYWMEGAIVVAIVATTGFMMFGGARSPHVMYRPEQIDITIDDVVGIDVVKEDVVRSLNLFLAHRTFADQIGGPPRRGLLFEGAPGTGKTHLAKAMAAEAGVPFLLRQRHRLPVQMYGATARKIRSVLQGAAQGGPPGGRCDRLHRGDRRDRRGSAVGSAPLPCPTPALPGDADGLRWSRRPAVDGCQLEPGHVRCADPEPRDDVRGHRWRRQRAARADADASTSPPVARSSTTKLIDWVNLFLPRAWQIARPVPPRTNILLIAATNRADTSTPPCCGPAGSTAGSPSSRRPRPAAVS